MPLVLEPLFLLGGALGLGRVLRLPEQGMDGGAADRGADDAGAAEPAVQPVRRLRHLAVQAAGEQPLHVAQPPHLQPLGFEGCDRRGRPHNRRERRGQERRVEPSAQRVQAVRRVVDRARHVVEVGVGRVLLGRLGSRAALEVGGIVGPVENHGVVRRVRRVVNAQLAPEEDTFARLALHVEEPLDGRPHLLRRLRVGRVELGRGGHAADAAAGGPVELVVERLG